MARARFHMADVLADPFATFGRARAAGWLAESDFGVAAVKHEVIRELLSDPRLKANFSDFLHTFGITSGAFHDWMSRSPLNKDGAEHQRWRTLMARTFTPRSVERIRPYLASAAHELIDGFAPRGGCEFVGEFADAYPSLGLCELIGVPARDRDRFRGWANTVGLGFSPIQLVERIAEVDEALTQLRAYASELAERRRAEPRDDLVSRIALAANDEGFSEDDTASFIAGLVFAGHETTRNQLGWMVAVLAGHVDVWEAVHTGTAGVNDVVEEALRYRSAVTGVGRRVEAPIEIDGERLEAGTQLFLSVWSADHDEAVYPEPERFASAPRSRVPSSRRCCAR